MPGRGTTGIEIGGASAAAAIRGAPLVISVIVRDRLMATSGNAPSQHNDARPSLGRRERRLHREQPGAAAAAYGAGQRPGRGAERAADDRPVGTARRWLSAPPAGAARSRQ